MSDRFTITVDGREIPAAPGQTILAAAQASGIYIPRLCHMDGIEPVGACRVCTVRANGRVVAACTQPATASMVVQSQTDELVSWRRQLVEMLFVEGNHFCMFCEKSGSCELQGLAYRLGIAAPRYESIWPKREVDASHPDIILDRNRCILCGRCERTSRDLDGKHVFGFVGRGIHKRLAVNARARLADTGADVTDLAIGACPVGAILRKNRAYRTPVGDRPFDREPIGAPVETRAELTINGGPAS
ncbi:MAG: hypothetical protein AMXMBFR58_34570 [Phycisphaerae bacterium]